MNRRPCLHPDTVIVRQPDGGAVTLLFLGLRELVLSDPLGPPLLERLDGTRTLTELVSAFGAGSAQAVLSWVFTLERQGFLVPAEPSSPAPARPLAGPLPATVAPAEPPPAEWNVALAAAAAEAGAVPDLDLAWVPDSLDPAILHYGRIASRPWLPITVCITEIRIGPLYRPGQAPCPACLAHRLRRNRAIRTFAESVAGPIPRPTLPSGTLYRAARLVIREAIAPTGVSASVRIYLADAEVPEHHHVVARPACPACDEPMAVRPLRLYEPGGTGGSDTADATLRTVSATEALDRLTPLVSPVTGLINNLARVPGSDGLQVFTAHIRPDPPPATWEELLRSLRFQAGGKGTDPVRAKVSALAEAIERHASRQPPTRGIERASYREVAERAIHPRDLLGFSDRQYATRQAEMPGSEMNRVPPPFDDTEPMDWAPVWSVTARCWRLVPAIFLHLSRSDPSSPCPGDSNGNAAGWTLDKAVLQGALELMERDATAIWWFNRLVRPGIHLAGIDDGWVQDLQDRYARLGRRFWVLDLTTDLGLPAMAAVSACEGDGPPRTCAGFGCHPNARVAVLQALTEMSQLLPHLLQHAEREDRLTPDSTRCGPPILADLRPDAHPFLCPDPRVPPIRIDSPEPAASNPLDALRDVIARIERAGHEVLVHDLSQPDLPLCVAKTIALGLRHYVQRLGSGRLYDVPVRMGWISAPIDETAMNPVNIGL